jgi:spore maturation protein B
MAIIRSLSGSGSAALVADMINQYGEDSIFVKMASTRHAVPAGLIADAASMLIAVWTVRLLFQG